MIASGEFKPKLDGDHPYRTTSRFQRDANGRLSRDEDGYPLPVAQEAALQTADRVNHKDKLAASERAAREARAMAKQRRRVKKRQGTGDPDIVHSRDEDFPLLAVLRRDKLETAVHAVLAYRQLVALCAAEPLKGVAYGDGSAQGVNIEYRSKLNDGVAEVEAAARGGFKGAKVDGGEIEYGGQVKKHRGAHSVPARRHLAVGVSDGGDAINTRTESLHIKVTEDVLLDRIDKFPILMRIRSALGSLVDPFEDAVLGGQKMGDIGKASGFAGRAAEIAGKALVLQGVWVVEPFLVPKKHKAANDNYLIERRKIA
jgi:hypothetical protein